MARKHLCICRRALPPLQLKPRRDFSLNGHVTEVQTLFLLNAAFQPVNLVINQKYRLINICLTFMFLWGFGGVSVCFFFFKSLFKAWLDSLCVISYCLSLKQEGFSLLKFFLPFFFCVFYQMTSCSDCTCSQSLNHRECTAPETLTGQQQPLLTPPHLTDSGLLQDLFQ